MNDKEAIECLRFDFDVALENGDEQRHIEMAIHAIETLAKVQALLIVHTEHLLTVGRRRAATAKLVDDLYYLVEAKLFGTM